MSAPDLREVSRTGLVTAALRAAETRRADRLYADPYAEHLAGRDGIALAGELQEFFARSGEVPRLTAFNAIRTRFFDDRLLASARAGVRQAVICASGMDTRAYRLPWPPGARVYELDYPEVLAAKHEALTGLGAAPRCDGHRLVGADLAAPGWGERLVEAGYAPGEPSVWILEGLLYYLDEPDVRTLLGRIAALTAPGATVAANVAAASTLRAPALQPMLRVFRDWGAPWVFGVDDPAALWREYGFAAEVVRPGEPGAHFGRWSEADATASLTVRLLFVDGTRSP
ncbi:SAM-dependent methyltransferase [Sphaerisporangium sp. TRM90804]|uniref:SAM-dependent methyltransferase n=1 Tax=Sphaerisporangium sp. TRM90804 TaxID=3031113 RepID=UPI00244C85C4|nr:SAM-dependent methyltransferase [Sphaerisporangium sp. TRM90804]MDH2429622.1 SAM-dependent methyltransferase [Sphaerisporangium sp. TRM90804]